MPIPNIAIVGGGFSGAMVLCNLVAEAKIPLSIDLFELRSDIAKGAAYGTKDPSHLLNVRANRMGAFADNPEGFWRWLQNRNTGLGTDDFAPRLVYADYLQSVLEAALKQAKEKSIIIHFHHAEVLDVKPKGKAFAIFTADRAFQADALVLATGNLKPRSFGFEAERHERFITDIWQSSFAGQNWAELSPDSEIVIIGTGLTTVDAILTLQNKGYKGKITMISRNGLLPLPHRIYKAYPDWDWIKNPASAPKTTLGLFVELRREVRIATEKGYDWRAVVDSIRPVTQLLWQNLDNSQKKRFLKRLFTLWNIHRHRMAPELHAKIVELQKQDILKILSGKIQDISVEEDGFVVNDIIKAKYIVNCSGPDYNIQSSGHRLLKGMHRHHLIAPSALNVGIELQNLVENIYPIGPLLLGELLECTAVPELRVQAKKIALNILNYVHCGI